MSYSSNGSGYVSDLKMNRSPKTQAGHSGCFIFSLPLCLHRGSVCLWTVASCLVAERLDSCLKAWVSPGHLQGCCPFLLCNFSSLIWPANSAHLKQTNKQTISLLAGFTFLSKSLTWFFSSCEMIDEHSIVILSTNGRLWCACLCLNWENY